MNFWGKADYVALSLPLVGFYAELPVTTVRGAAKTVSLLIGPKLLLGHIPIVCIITAWIVDFLPRGMRIPNSLLSPSNCESIRWPAKGTRELALTLFCRTEGTLWRFSPMPV